MNLAVPDNLDSIVDRRKMYEYNKVETLICQNEYNLINITLTFHMFFIFERD